MRWFLLAVLLGAVVSVPAPAAGQYLKRLDPKTPRLPDGKPNMNAPLPRRADGKPDLNGLWNAVAKWASDSLWAPHARGCWAC